MSNIYIKEPPTIGKVLLHTSMGDVDVELWSKEAPLACRNFVQLCMEGYYNGLIFHRVVPNFIVQGGDPLGTGQGGESVYGKPFKDEFHSRLRFVRRGLVAMANSGPNDNGSQFFFTLASCTDLNKKHTIFGKVSGDTVYNLVRLGEVDTDDNERPINPPSIKWTKVLSNPFDDVIPRVVTKEKKEEKTKKKKSQMKATKDFKLLSFGEEAEEEEEDTRKFDQAHNTGSKSSHDLAKDPKLSSIPALVLEEDKEEKRKMEEEMKKRVKDVQEKLQNNPAKSRPAHNNVSNTSQSEDLKKESRKLAREILNARKRKQPESDHSDVTSDDDDVKVSNNPEFVEYKEQQKIYREKMSTAKNKSSSRESDTLAMLKQFSNTLSSTRDQVHWTADVSDDDPDDVGDDDDGCVRHHALRVSHHTSPRSGRQTWRSKTEKSLTISLPRRLCKLLHRLKNDPGFRDAKDMNREVNEDRYELSDPRNPLNKRRREESKRKKEKPRRR